MLYIICHIFSSCEMRHTFLTTFFEVRGWGLLFFGLSVSESLARLVNTCSDTGFKIMPPRLYRVIQIFKYNMATGHQVQASQAEYEVSDLFCTFPSDSPVSLQSISLSALNP